MGNKARLERAWGLLKGQALSGSGARCALLDLSAQMSGFQHWHEAHERGKSVRAAPRPLSDSASPKVLIRIERKGPRLGGAGADGALVDFSALGADHRFFSEALGALALCFPAPDTWSAQAWRQRALGLSRMLPEALQEMSDLGEPCSLSFLASWEGISRARALFDKSELERLGSRWIEWARPWHSTFATVESGARISYEPMARAWAGVETLISRAQGGSQSWLAMAETGSLCVDPGERGAWLALAKTLLRSQGLSGALAILGSATAEDAKAGLRHFPPSN